MTLSHSNPPDVTRPDSFRWSRTDIAHALQTYAHAETVSQRDFAQQHGIPHATFNYWTRHDAPDRHDPLDGFFRSPDGEQVLRRLLTAVLLVFQLRGTCGLRLVGDFLALAQLDRYVAGSRGALQPLAAHLEADLVVYRDTVQPALAQAMTAQAITLVADEHFHSGRPCLVGQEPVSGFLLVESYRDRRDAVTWQTVIAASTQELPVTIIQITSDQARALICCAEKGLQATHSPDLFHGQRDLLQPLLLPLTRPVISAEKAWEQAQQDTEQRDLPLDEPCPVEQMLELLAAVKTETCARLQVAQTQERRTTALEQVQGVGDDYHPFDRQTGRPLTAAEVGHQLHAHLDRLGDVVQAAELGATATAALEKARTWVGVLVGCVAWFWNQATSLVAALDLSAAQERLVRTKLLPSLYWRQAARRARTAAERQRLRTLAETLYQEAWHAEGELALLTAAAKQRVERVATQSVGLFQRSSSCVEGRNGRLSLQQHGHSRVSEGRLQALTVIHNYLVERVDGTTAAERFFGQRPPEMFAWLVQRLPELPRPARKRPAPALSVAA